MGDSRTISPPEGAPTPHPVAIGLGSNMGDRRRHFEGALDRLAASVQVCALSSLYESAPIGGPPQGVFLNAAVLVAHVEPLESLLATLQGIEGHLGRVRLERWGPRTIDLDILWAGSRISRTSSLIVPHPQLTRRRFALAPLLDVFPDATDPLTGAPYREILGQLEDQQLTRIDGENWWKRSPA